MPVRFFEGIRPEERDELNRRNLDRRFYALAAAVKEHEVSARSDGDRTSADDESLYRRLRQLSGEPVNGEHRRVS